MGGLAFSCQRGNEATLLFLAACKYTLDATTPSVVDPSADEDAYDCELLSKLWDEATAATLKQRGADATKRMEKERAGGGKKENAPAQFAKLSKEAFLGA